MDVMNDFVDRVDTAQPTVTFTEQDRRFVYDVARRIVGDPDAAADVAQDSLLLAYRHRDRFRGESLYRTWLYRIAVSAALSHLRRRRRTSAREALVVGEGDGPVEPSPSPEQQVAAGEAVARACRALAALDDQFARVLQLRFLDDLSEAEVARALGLSLATVKIRTHRGRHALRAALSA
jgi:RNA polymerase sigma-70 factor (ECF subfamily)